ncbi:MAG: pantoate--beta-alanine ligase [Cyclobacteriaceae bacterium]
MKKFNSIASLRLYLDAQRQEGLEIGLVPTMGALHAGHFELIKRSQSENDLTVVSVFVNPAQFNNPEDLQKYPRNVEEDLSKLENLGCDAVFTPGNEEMYSHEAILSFNVGYLDSIMEGRFRPGHFSGVALVVAKLFNIIEPAKAYFGQKDLQQLILVKYLVKELNFQTQIVGVPIVREESGLAMSSRNKRLSDAQLEIAKNIYSGLKLVAEKLNTSISIKDAQKMGKQFYADVEDFELEYLEIVDGQNLAALGDEPSSDTEIAICVAGFVGDVRLLDNICFPLKDSTL